jgi:hypothetical protein
MEPAADAAPHHLQAEEVKGQPEICVFPALGGYLQGNLSLNAQLWPGADHTAGYVLARLVSMKTGNRMTRDSMEDILGFVHWMCPGAASGLPRNTKEVDRVITWATEGVFVIIPACPGGCVLFRDSDPRLPAHFPIIKRAASKRCPVCYAARYLGTTKTPQKVLFLVI